MYKPLRTSRRILVAIAIAAAVPLLGQAASNAPIGALEIAPLFYQRFACTEHVNGELSDLVWVEGKSEVISGLD